MRRLTTILLALAVVSAADDNHHKGRGDSYWDAYLESNGGGGGGTAIGADFNGASGPSPLYDSPNGPSPSYNEPPGPYPGPRRPPHKKHPYQGPRYPPGPPSPVYGPGPVEPPYEPAFGSPFSIPGHGLLDLDVATLCKIILKVLLFKMIVKFIAVICLLLFLPKLKEHKQSGNNNNGNCDNGNNDDDGDRSQGRSSSRLDALTALVWDSVDRNATMYEDIDDQTCERDVRCRIRRVAAAVDEKSTFPRLFSLFLHERLNDTIPSTKLPDESTTEEKPK